MTEFCIQETWRSVKLLHQKELVDAFNANEKNWAGKPRAATEPVCRDAINAQLWMCGLQQEFGWLRISRPSSDLWGGIGTTTQTTQQMGGGPGIKRQSAPDAFLSFPASRAVVRYIHENHANNECHRMVARSRRKNGRAIPARTRNMILWTDGRQRPAADMRSAEAGTAAADMRAAEAGTAATATAAVTTANFTMGTRAAAANFTIIGWGRGQRRPPSDGCGRGQRRQGQRRSPSDGCGRGQRHRGQRLPPCIGC